LNKVKVTICFGPEDFEDLVLTRDELDSLIMNMEDILFIKVLGKKNKVFYGQGEFKF
jgi:hypothetical protein